MIKVLTCSCASTYQDAKYGVGKRVHNHAPRHGFRCTVCGNVKEAK